MDPMFYGSDFLTEDADVSAALNGYDETSDSFGSDTDLEAAERYLSDFEAPTEGEYDSEDWN